METIDAKKTSIWNREAVDLQDFFSYRNFCMAFAILWVVLFHASLSIKGNMPWNAGLRLLQRFGYGGVDIFLFLSGLGCYFSLKKNSDTLAFLHRRFDKIMPAYFLFLLVFIPWILITSSPDVFDIIGNITCMGYLAGRPNQFNWYLTGAWVCYFIAPLSMGCFAKESKPWVKPAIFALLLLISLCWIDNKQLLLWSRLPIFFLGMCLADYSTKHSSLKLKHVFLCIISMAGGDCCLNISMPLTTTNYGTGVCIGIRSY